MTFQTWFQKVEQVFAENGFNAKNVGWQWLPIFEEGYLDPEEAFDEYCETLVG